ncbi:MAG: homoserine kinase [Bacteroidales bacterium]|nr:homoserine kinase [Bacteroidales bacterium]
MKRIKVRAPATSANVGPGYDIFALALEDPFDEIELLVSDEGGIDIDIENDTQGIPRTVADNTAGLAVSELFRRKGIHKGVRIRIIKRMCSGGGLGTTGASAAGAVSGLNTLLELGLTHNEMIDIARMGEVASGGSPHADNVAAAIMGGFILVKSYFPVDVLKLELPDIPVVLAAITKSQRTTRGFITYEIGQEKLKEQMARCSRVIHAIHSGDPTEFGKAVSVDYIHEPVRGSAIPGYWEIKKKILDTGAYGCTISGGGSSVIAFCPENCRETVAELMNREFSSNPHFIRVYQTRISNSGIRVLEME